MKIINAKDHTNKYMEISKKAAEGIYPSKRIAKIGSIAGLCIGVVLALIGVYGIINSASFGTGSLIAGVVTCISNVVNLKRIRSKNEE